MGEDELKLIRRSLDGDKNAWGEIVKRYKISVFGVALGILGNPADAEDAAQDAFIRAYQGLHTFHLDKRFSTWIFAITANLCKNKLRRDRLLAPLKYITRATQSHHNPEAQLAQDQRSQTMRDALDQLSPKYRMPLVLRYYGDLEYKEIAEMMKLPEGTVKTRIHRAKSELKRLLEQKGVVGHART
ncbi:sigma-70 family RNA polymerase sigma factor [Candidatus Acetothermia bacterium]|jgi:RNA polymerase sigma-70 factor (ECF subfamily)|nr:sigma-70 family RNA polymerase sigma factor [Candidatus Acetothermia bacterium]MCI2431695.1 sigma-70 family RNA polymerase sigma factor [Candidatus Acetothermia bacterium]MCI2435670.1 sigma-70 family RNA polymerase sigma factor [Candidatus Acetothermia bacterium]